ncbi:hypothetical protein L1887_35610 [Cichorium endivia]|nr:hypothetical protein L1887_35610 [Cichorium endivia]
MSIKPTGTSTKRFLPSRLLSSPRRCRLPPSLAVSFHLRPAASSLVRLLLCFSKVSEKVHIYNASDIKKEKFPSKAMITQ